MWEVKKSFLNGNWNRIKLIFLWHSQNKHRINLTNFWWVIDLYLLVTLFTKLNRFEETPVACIAHQVTFRLRKVLHKLWNTFRNLFNELWNTFRNLFHELWNTFRNLFHELWNTFHNLFGTFRDSYVAWQVIHHDIHIEK